MAGSMPAAQHVRVGELAVDGEQPRLQGPVLLDMYLGAQRASSTQSYEPDVQWAVRA